MNTKAWWVSLWAVACGGVASPETVVRDALRAEGATFDDQGVAHFAEPDTAIVVTAIEVPCRVQLRTSGWAGLDEAAGTAGVARLLTEIAARNAETVAVRIGLDAASGAVEADINLWCAGGLSADAAADAVRIYHNAIRDLRTPIRKAATLAPL